MLKYFYTVLFPVPLLLVQIAYAFEMNEQMRVYLNEATIIEGGFPSGLSDDLSLPFADYMSEHWEHIVGHIEDIAKTEREQAIISVSAELMPSHEYLDFVIAFLKKCEEGVVHRSVVKETTLRPGALRYGFFEYNFNHPKVREILLYGKKLFVDDQLLNETLDDILSGVEKEWIDDWLSMAGRAAPEVLVINNNLAEHSSLQEQSLTVPIKRKLEFIEEVSAPEPTIEEEPTEVVDTEPIEEDVEQSSNWPAWLENWWLCLIGAVVVGGILKVRLKK